MIVAMFPMLPVDVTADNVIDVAGMRDRSMLTADAVYMIACMRTTGVRRIAWKNVGRSKFVFVHVVAVRMMQMSIVNVVDVIAVMNR